MPLIDGDFTVKEMLDLNVLLEEYLRDNPVTISLTILGGANNNQGTVSAVRKLQRGIIAGLEQDNGVKEALEEVEKEVDANFRDYMNDAFATVDSLVGAVNEFNDRVGVPRNVGTSDDCLTIMTCWYQDERILQVTNPDIVLALHDWVETNGKKYQVASVSISYSEDECNYHCLLINESEADYE